MSWDDAESNEGGLVEHAFACPYCGESISMLLDLSEPDQEYVEDCEVCCNPIGLHVRASRGALVRLDVTDLS
ncbi:MAG: CPXCG motif-containing cysteine-rich protein [Gemmatimonadetes bacterium]|nr:CPXCG motif-containing cysteine-rich protein [Gemmatimonadota bacterium]